MPEDLHFLAKWRGFKYLICVIFCLAFILVLSPTKAFAQTIRVSGFNSSRNLAPLTGFIPNAYFEEDYALPLKNALLDPTNFGPNGTVSCSVEFKPFTSSIPSGLLVENGQKKFEVFFAGLSNSDLTSEEADELFAFIRAGGIVYVAGGGYSSYQGLGTPGHDGSRFNPLFSSLGIADRLPAGEVIDFYPCGTSSTPVNTPVTMGPFGSVGPLAHNTFNPINTSGLQSVATGFNELCFIGMSLENNMTIQSENSGDYNRTILAEGKFGNGYLSVMGEPLYLYTELDANAKTYFLNLFSLACSGGSEQPPTPFLDLPWDYKGKDFNDAALSINSYFDHEYPLLSTNMEEPSFAKGKVKAFKPEVPEDVYYSSHDGYDWGKLAGARKGEPVLAAADGIATARGVDDCKACGNHVLIDHENGYQTRYYHLMDEGLIVATNSGETKRVVKGQKIGLVGYSGYVKPKGEKGAHLHFMVIEDKDRDGNFDDNIPDGITDPFGWQSKEPDPWPNYIFTYKGVQRTGNKSYYLWTKPIDNLSEELTSNAGFFRLKRFELNFPEQSTSEPLTVNMQYSPAVTISESLESIGAALFLNVIDASGNPVTTFPKSFTLTIDFKDFDISRFRTDSISVYSSPDGINWTKEDTQVDFENKVATVTLNHASYFALIGEKKDAISPTTTTLLLGEEGESGWFRSEVKVILDAQDNEGGLGVDYTLYSLNEQQWQEYITPLTFTDEGDYTIEFYSVDKDENIEDTKSVVFHIDKTPPEVRIQFNPDRRDTEVMGIDENQVDVSFEELEGESKSDLIVVEDKAGNTLKIFGKFKRKDKIDTFAIEGLQYNDGEIIKFDKNLFTASFVLDKRTQSLSHLLQSWFDKGDTLLSVYYDSKRNESIIIKKDHKEKIQKETKAGLILLYVETSNSNLKFGYQ